MSAIPSDKPLRPPAGPGPSDTGTPSMAELVHGILADVQELLRQQFEFFHQELRGDYRRTRDVAVAFAAGAALTVTAAVLLLAALVGFLHWLVPAVPLWGWSAILGGLFLIAGAALAYGAKRKLDSTNLLPNQTVQVVKENVQWIKQQVTSE